MKLLKKNFLIFIFFRKSDAFIFLNSLRKQGDLSLLTKKGIQSLLNSKPQHNLQIYFEFIFNIQVSQP